MRCELSKRGKMISVAVVAVVAVSSTAMAQELKQAVVWEAGCGPHVTGVSHLDNGIGNVRLAYRQGKTLVFEEHLIANPELCRKVQSSLSFNPDGKSPYLVSLAAERVFFGHLPLANVTISDKGLERMDDVQKAPAGSKLYEKFYEGYKTESSSSFLQAEKQAAARPTQGVINPRFSPGVSLYHCDLRVSDGKRNIEIRNLMSAPGKINENPIKPILSRQQSKSEIVFTSPDRISNALGIETGCLSQWAKQGFLWMTEEEAKQDLISLAEDRYLDICWKMSTGVRDSGDGNITDASIQIIPATRSVVDEAPAPRLSLKMSDYGAPILDIQGEAQQSAQVDDVQLRVSCEYRPVSDETNTRHAEEWMTQFGRRVADAAISGDRAKQLSSVAAESNAGSSAMSVMAAQ